jgi:NAD(P)-dependent dehydrogenase (short-subunit alcohol dehydrogenase family)
MNDFMDKVILITGAGSGAGRRLAEALAARGAILALVDINPLGLDETAAHIAATGDRSKAYLVDTAKRLPVVALVNQVLDDWGRIDVLVNAAEVRPADPLLTMDEWDFHRTLDVNLAGPFFLMQRVAQVMKNQPDGGLMVIAGGFEVVETQNIASPPGEGAAYLGSQASPPGGGAAYLASQASPPGGGAAYLGSQASPPGGGAAYLASMAALTALIQAAAQEFKAYNIEVLRIEDFRLQIEDL